MRGLLAIALLGLAVPLAGSMGVAAAAPAKKAVATLILRAEGLSIVGRTPTPIRATFDTTRAKAIATIASIRGPAIKTGRIEDCGSGTPMDFAKFKGGLDLYFIGGKFVGWYIDEGADASLKTMKGVGLGTTRKAFKAAYPAATIEESTLGTEYGSDDAGSGLFASDKPDAKVTAMWAGQTCIAR
ncbi:MAG: hypothetical protein V4459_06220 [Pseudomonadota bacterium]